MVLYDYVAQRGDEIQLTAGQLAQLLDTSERDWWRVAALDGTNRIGYFPSSYLAQLYQNERPLQVAQTIQVSDGETCDKLLRGQVSSARRREPHVAPHLQTLFRVGPFFADRNTFRALLQIVIHTGKQLDNFVTIRTVRPNASSNEEPAQTLVNYIQCPEKYLLDI